MELQTLKNDVNAWCVGGRTMNEFVNPTGEIIANAVDATFGMDLGNLRTINKSGYADTVTSPKYPVGYLIKWAISMKIIFLSPTKNITR
jgi:hypothetical protein